MSPSDVVLDSCDVVIIGAGVVGLACAERLSRDGREVLVLERHPAFGRETSSRNSGVIHAGMYYPTGSLKARLCVPGNRSLYAWCEERRVPFARTGKYIVATSAEDEAILAGILARGRANGVAGLEPVTGAAIAEAEPNVIATAGLWSPDTGIVDVHALMASLFEAARARGAVFAWRHAVTGIEPGGGGYRMRVVGPGGEPLAVNARAVVNAAGLACDELAAMTGIDVDAVGYRLTYVRGLYFRIGRRGLVRRLIYPVPPADLRGLGVHVTLDLDGGLRLGPNAEVLRDRSLDYGVPESAAPAFFEAASRYLRGLRPEDLTPDQAGIRPKLLAGSGPSDFVIAEEAARGLPGWVNLVGIESPGLTCCIEIGARVAELLG